VRDAAGGNASDRSGGCDWRESLQAEAQREARHASVGEPATCSRRSGRASKSSAAERDAQGLISTSSRAWVECDRCWLMVVAAQAMSSKVQHQDRQHKQTG
jgi:hypothetical protein